MYKVSFENDNRTDMGCSAKWILTFVHNLFVNCVRTDVIVSLISNFKVNFNFNSFMQLSECNGLIYICSSLWSELVKAILLAMLL